MCSSFLFKTVVGRLHAGRKEKENIKEENNGICKENRKEQRNGRERHFQ